MAWSGGTYTKGNNGTGGWVGDASLGIGIEAGRHDTQDNDFATGINQCLNKDGSNAATGNLNIGAFKITNMATGTASGDATTLGQVQAGINTQSTALSITNTQFSADTTGANISLQKSRGATVGTNTIASSGDTVGTITFAGANGTGYTTCATITAAIDGTPGASNDMPGRLIFSTTVDGAGTPTERMRITNAGNVGIGNNAPSVFIDATRTANDGTSRFRIQNASTGSSAQSAVEIGNDVNASAGGMRINSNANTSGAGISGMEVFNALGGNLDLSTNGTNRFRITSAGRCDFRNGEITIAASAITSGAGTNALRYSTTTGLVTYDTSSQLIKDNIVDCPIGLSEVLCLQPRKYFRKDDQRDELGFIADEMANVIPEVVSYCEKSRFTKNEDDTEMVPGAIAYEKLTSVLCKAIQELNAKVEALEATVAELGA